MAPPDDICEIDPDQLKLVNNFKTKLEKIGTYYWPYRGPKEFEQFIRRHLTLQLQELKQNRSDKTTADTKNELTEIDAIDSLEEMGYLDLIELRDDNFEASKVAAEHIAKAVTDFGKNLNDRSSELDKAQESKSRTKIKYVINHAAEDMEIFANIIDTESSIFASSFLQGINASSKIVDLYISFNPTDKNDLMDQPPALNDLKNSFEFMLRKEVEFKSVIKGFSHMTTKLVRAKKHLLSSLETFEGEIRNATNLLSDLIASIELIVDQQD